MIDNNQTANVKLTLEQLQQLDVFQTKLITAQNDISVATKNLKVIITDCKRYESEKLLAQGVVERLEKEIDEKTLKSAKLDEEIVEKTAQLNSLLDTIREQTVFQEKKSSDLKERERILLKNEADYTNRVNIHTKKEIYLNEKVDIHNEKVAKLKEAIKDL